ncbi:MAG: hypothetical protein NTU44_10425, partial [Bacteroidetes bacterium]|nr:hypothetical protein [Bacteroidota bacterium]
DIVITFCPVLNVAGAGVDIMITKGVGCILQANFPEPYNTGHWTVTSGTGGLFADPSLNTTQFTGQPYTIYVLRWTITSACDTSYDEVIVVTSSVSSCWASVDYGGKTYHTIKVGSQCWMRENLDIGTMVDSYYSGSPHSDCSDDGVIEKYCYNNDPANCAIYGGIYDWDEMMTYVNNQATQGICPAGFHIPTNGEWQALVTFLGGTLYAGGKMKEPGTTHWTSQNIGATNESGFTALGTGNRLSEGDFGQLQDYGYFWSSTENTADFAWIHSLYSGDTNVEESYGSKTLGYPVRCIKD